MTNEQQQVKDMMLAFQQECPDKPCIPSLETRKFRAKLILEEALETIIALGFEPRIRIYTRPNTDYGFDIHLFEHPFGTDLKEILDGCEDLKVVTEGTLLACGLCPNIQGEYGEGEDPHFNEVMRSNMSKMWTAEEIYKEFRPNIPATIINEYPELLFCKHETKDWTAFNIKNNKPKCYVVKNKDGKFIKSPSYSPPNFKL